MDDGLMRDESMWQKHRWKLIMLFVALFAFIGLSFTSSVNVNAADDESGVKDYSMYHRASEVATAFGTAMAPDSEGEGTSPWLDGLNVGNAGGLLGYSRDLQEDEGGVVGWITSDFSANTVTYTFDQLISMGKGRGSDSADNNALLGYGLYGAQLQKLGLVDSKEQGFIELWAGRFFLAAYYFAQLVPIIFNVIMQLLKMLNPFQLFFGAIDGLSSANLGVFSSLAEQVSEIYSIFQNLALFVTIPIFIGLTMVSIFMFQGNAGKKLLRVFLRIFMIFAGLPLIGATYTSIINNVGDNVDMTTPFADYVIATQFVDTEGWIKSSRLAPPDSSGFITPIAIPNKDSNYTFKDVATRAEVLNINRTRVSGNSGLDRIGNLTLDTLGGTNATDVEKQNTYRRIGSDLLLRYVAQDKFTASDYEGFVKSQLDNSSSMRKNVSDMFSPGVSELNDKDGTYDEVFRLGGDVSAIDNPYTIYNMGFLEAEGYKMGGSSSFKYTTPTGDVSGSAPSSSNTNPNTPIGLSPLSMYNFLNTRFTTQSLTVYSPVQSSSVYTANEYASVSRVNNGFFGFIYGMESFVLLVVSAIVGLAYALGLFKIAVASVPQILTSVFGTAVGSMAMITKLLIASIVLIVEIIGTITLYVMFDSILVSLLQGTDEILKMVSITSNGVIETMGSATLTIVLGVSMSIFAIRNRGKFGKMIEEIATDIMTKLMGGLDNTANQGSWMHDGNEVAQAGQAASIHGHDGQVGTEGSGIYDSKASAGLVGAGAEDRKSKSIMGSMKDAASSVQSEAALEAHAKKDDENYVPRSRAELAAETASRFKDRKSAQMKDKLAKTLGPAGAALSLAGISNLDGHAEDRIRQHEDLKLEEIRDEARGFNKIGQDSDSAISEAHGLDSIDDDGTESLDDFQAGINTIENQDSSAIVNEGADSEVLDYYEDDGIPLSDGDEYGTVAEAAIDEDTQVYGDMDREADTAMAEVFGDDADSVSLDDPKDHANVIPLTEEHSEYIDGLTEASDMQYDVAESHAKESAKLMDEAERLDNQILEAEAKPDKTRQDMDHIDDMKKEATGLKARAEMHREQAVAAAHKGEKLATKRDDAQMVRDNANEAPLKERQGQAVHAANQYEESIKKVDGLIDEQDAAYETLEQYRTAGNQDGVTRTQDEIKSISQQLDTARVEQKEAEQQLVESLPELPENHPSYGMSEYTPDKPKLSNGQKERVQTVAASTLAGLAAVAGETEGTPEGFKQVATRQKAYMDRLNTQYQEKMEPIKQDMDTARTELQGVTEQFKQASEEGAPPEVLQKHSKRAKSLKNKIEHLQSEEAQLNAYQDIVSAGYVANKNHLSDQEAGVGRVDHVDESNNMATQSRKRQGDIVKRIKPDLMPAGAPVLSDRSAIKTQSARLRTMGIETPEDMANYYREVTEPVERIENEIKRVDKNIQRANTKGDLGMVQRYRDQRETLVKQQRNVQAKATADTKKLKKNLSGVLDNNKYVPKNVALTNGRPIKSDLYSSLKVYQDLSKDLVKKEKLENDKSVPQSTLNKFDRAINVRKKQLLDAGFSPQSMSTSTNAVASVESIYSEIENILKGTNELEKASDKKRQRGLDLTRGRSERKSGNRVRNPNADVDASQKQRMILADKRREDKE